MLSHVIRPLVDLVGKLKPPPPAPPPPPPPSLLDGVSLPHALLALALAMVAVIVVQTLRDSLGGARRRRSSTPKDPEIDKAFDLIDSDHDGKLTRIEVVKAIRSQKSIQTLLGLSYVRQEDGTREKFEQVFQACDTDNSRTLERDEFQRFFHEMKAHPHRRNSADSRAFLDELSKTPRGELRRALKLR